MTSLPLDLLAPPKSSDDKYSRGVVGFVTGSVEYPGAAVMGVLAAQAVGIGMIRYLGPESVMQYVLQFAPEAVTLKGQAQAWVFGSGVSGTNSSQFEIFNSLDSKYSVLDAGALELVEFPVDHPTILTPHAGEAARLLTRLGHETKSFDVKSSPLEAAEKIASLTSATVLLKGNRVAVADGSEAKLLEPSASELATAGTGDVLAGILGSLLARRVALEYQVSLLKICELGVLLQSNAAKLAAVEGPVSAMDVVKKIRQAVKTLVG
jgi:hydroxyethylthiazole kinase-like uncharacterized protein yjeF